MWCSSILGMYPGLILTTTLYADKAGSQWSQCLLVAELAGSEICPLPYRSLHVPWACDKEVERSCVDVIGMHFRAGWWSTLSAICQSWDFALLQRRILCRTTCTRSVLWKKSPWHLKNLEVGLRLLQLSMSGLVRPDGQKPWNEKPRKDLRAV